MERVILTNLLDCRRINITICVYYDLLVEEISKKQLELFETFGELLGNDGKLVESLLTDRVRIRKFCVRIICFEDNLFTVGRKKGNEASVQIGYNENKNAGEQTTCERRVGGRGEQVDRKG